MKNEKALKWFNSLGQTKRLDLSMDYYGRDLILDEEIQSIYEQENRYYIEFDKRRYLSVFPDDQKDKNKTHKTINEALDYMIELGVKEITIKN